MKVNVAPVFKDKERINQIMDILKIEYLLRDKNQEMNLAEFVRVRGD